MPEIAARWRTARFAFWAGNLASFAIALALAFAQGVHISGPSTCVTESHSIWRALPWLLVGALPVLSNLLIRTLATRAPQESTAVGAGPYRASVANTTTRFYSPPAHDVVRVLTLLVALGIGAAQSRTWSCPFAVPASCHPTLDKIILVPVGNIEPAVVQGLAKHFRDCYSLPVSAGDTIAAPPSSHDPKRNQWIAENLIDAIPGCKTGDPSCEHALFIGITDFDIYMSENATRFAWIFTARNDERHVEIVSTFHMASYDAQAQRVSKVVARNIALDYCNLPISDNPRSVLSPVLGGERDLDNIDESVW
jgi:predicted Zn-dependent protease